MALCQQKTAGGRALFDNFCTRAGARPHHGPRYPAQLRRGRQPGPGTQFSLAAAETAGMSGIPTMGTKVYSTTSRPTAFEDFYRTRADRLLRFATNIAGPDVAEDACQDAWLRMWRSWGTADADKVDAWARQIVRNCCVDRRRNASVTLDDAVLEAATGPEPEELAVRRAEVQRLSERIGMLAPPLRDVLYAREVVGMTYAEIAEAYAIPIGTVMSRLHSARRKLARATGAKAARS